MENLRAQVLWETRYSGVISGGGGRGAPYISLQPRGKMERGLRAAVGLDDEGSGVGAQVPRVWGIRCHSQSLDMWCGHYRDSSWQTEL
jgi:hypothetical protein